MNLGKKLAVALLATLAAACGPAPIKPSESHIRAEDSPPPGAIPPPVQLRSGGRGQGYDNPHRHPSHLGPQELAPDEVVGARFYTPDDSESELARRLAEIRRARGRDG